MLPSSLFVEFNVKKNRDNVHVIYLQLLQSLGQMPTDAQVVRGRLLFKERKVTFETRRNVCAKRLATKTVDVILLI